MRNASAVRQHRRTLRRTAHDIGPADLWDVLKRGLDDFLWRPTHVIFLIIIYPILGLFLGRLIFGYGLLQFLYPVVAGFALVGPFASVGLYEVSRRREQGISTRWGDVLAKLRHKSARPVLALGGVLVLIFFAWLGAAQWIYWLTFGNAVPASLSSFLAEVFTTEQGWRLLILGNAVGLIFAIVVLAISVVSFPMLVDRDVSALTAVQTSVAVCLDNPLTMLLWGLIVAVCLALGSLPFFVGLAVVLPVLGHATWHLYRKLVPPS